MGMFEVASSHIAATDEMLKKLELLGIVVGDNYDWRCDGAENDPEFPRDYPTAPCFIPPNFVTICDQNVQFCLQILLSS